jgi:hypothetical protein
MPEPVTIGTALTTAGGGVSLMNNIITFVQNARKAKQDPRLADVLARIPGEAFSLAGQYIQQVQDLRQELLKAGVDLGKTQRAVLAETGRLHIKRRNLLTRFAANIDAIETQLSRFLDDAVALADCCGDDDFVVTSFVEAEEIRTVIHRETDPGIPLGVILKSLEGRAQDLRAALGDMIKG